jgi:hypothetical protein
MPLPSGLSRTILALNHYFLKLSSNSFLSHLNELKSLLWFKKFKKSETVLL